MSQEYLVELELNQQRVRTNWKTSQSALRLLIAEVFQIRATEFAGAGGDTPVEAFQPAAGFSRFLETYL